jgi:hypothetical protein
MRAIAHASREAPCLVDDETTDDAGDHVADDSTSPMMPSRPNCTADRELPVRVPAV